MKKLIIIIIAAISFNAASAQSRNGTYKKQDRGQVTQAKNNHNYNDQSGSNGYAYNNSHNNRDYAYNNNYGKNDDRDRQAQYDRVNRQYDQRINEYDNDRSINSRERYRRINEAQQERQRSLAGFGTGAVAGGVVGFILGALVSH
jgi:hypothetical protein